MPSRPPESQLIYERRIQLGLSFRKAAEEAGISEGSWRRTEGTRDLARTAGTVARMALATGVTPAELEAAGRADAAQILETLLAAPAGGDPYAELEAAVARVNEIAGRILRDRGDDPAQPRRVAR